MVDYMNLTPGEQAVMDAKNSTIRSLEDTISNLEIEVADLQGARDHLVASLRAMYTYIHEDYCNCGAEAPPTPRITKLLDDGFAAFTRATGDDEIL